MNNNYIHSKKNNINILYLICSIFLIIYGFYKNGILLYNEIDNKITLLKPIIIPLISLFTSYAVGYIKNRNFKLNDNIIYMLILSLCLPINTSLIIFGIACVIMNFLLYYILDKPRNNINYICLFKLLIIGILFIMNKYIYPNDLEIINKYSYNLKDIFFGRGISGIDNSSMMLIIISYFILCSNYYYKKEIPLFSLAIYFLLSLIFKFGFHHVIIFNSMILYSFIFIESLSLFSPSEKKEQIIYSIIVGILTFFITYYFNRYDGVIIAILVSSLMNFINIK